jgi:surface antigen
VKRKLSGLLAFTLGCLGLMLINPPPAYADDGGYPYAAYAGPGTNAAQFTWTDENGHWFSQKYKFAYRNCTDYVAWKLDAANGWYVGESMGHAKDWKAWAQAKPRNYTVDDKPAPGAVAWWGGHAWNSGYGHVAYVHSVSSDGKKVTLGEYNYSLDGTYSSRTINKEAVDGYIHFKDLSDTQPSANNTVLRVIKKNQSDGTNAVYWAKADSVYESWWRPGGDGVHHNKIVDIPQGDVKDIDVQVLGGNLHLLYTATAHNVYETWWYPNQGLHTSNPPIAHSDSTIRKILKMIAPDGVHQLYVMTDAGIDEYWWRPDGPIAKTRIFTLANPVAMKKFFEPDGRQSLYVADQGYAYEVWWRPGVPGFTIGQIIHISQNDIVDIDLTVDAGTNQHHLFVAEAGSGAWEAKWTPGLAGIAYWHLTADNGVRAIQSYRDGSSYNLYVATAGGVYEYWWPAGTTELHAEAVVSGLNNVREFDRSTSVDGAPAVYTAFGTNIAETYWWGPGQPLMTSTIE